MVRRTLVPIDVKNLGQDPTGGSWRGLVQTKANHHSGIDKTPMSYDFVHSLVDDHSRLACIAILPDEKVPTWVGFLQRARGLLRGQGHRPSCSHEAIRGAGIQLLNHDQLDTVLRQQGPQRGSDVYPVLAEVAVIEVEACYSQSHYEHTPPSDPSPRPPLGL